MSNLETLGSRKGHYAINFHTIPLLFGCQWPFQIPKLEVLYPIKPYLVGISPYIDLTLYIYIYIYMIIHVDVYGRYLQFGFLKTRALPFVAKIQAVQRAQINRQVMKWQDKGYGYELHIWATAKNPAILNMYWTDIGLWKLMEIVKNTR